MVSKMIVACAAVACLLALAEGYSGGAPVDVCEDMTPKHPAAPQKSEMPYEITVNKNSIRSGDTVKITISGKDDFKGFLVQVRKGNEPSGKFVVSSSDRFIKTISCGKGEQVMFEMFRRLVSCLFPPLKQMFMVDMLQNAATHKNSELKNKLALNWKSPAGAKGEYTVYVTVAQDGGTYWVRQKKATIKLN